MAFLKSTVGRKIIMAVSGLMMLLFVIMHLLGNSSVFAGPAGINVYAAGLHSLGPLVWIFRLIMICMFLLHLFYGIRLTLENNTARPQGYAVKKNMSATFASKNMIWTGSLIGLFLIYHLLHFTFQYINPEISASSNTDAMGRPDVFMMMVQGFQNLGISALYIVAMVAVVLHLTHGIQSLFQTLGLNNDGTFPVVKKIGTAAAFIVFIGYISIPLIIVAGLLRP